MSTGLTTVNNLGVTTCLGSTFVGWYCKSPLLQIYNNTNHEVLLTYEPRMGKMKLPKGHHSYVIGLFPDCAPSYAAAENYIQVTHPDGRTAKFILRFNESRGYFFEAAPNNDGHICLIAAWPCALEFAGCCQPEYFDNIFWSIYIKGTWD